MYNQIWFIAIIAPLIYKFKIPIIIGINNLYFWFRNITEDYIYQSFKDININKISIDNNEIIVYKYSYKNDNYIILSNINTFIKRPYTIEYIKKQQNSNDTSLHSKDNILCAEIETKDGQTIDCIEYIQKLCGPLGDFYKETSVEIKPIILKIFLESLFNTTIENLIIMTSLGDEINLLNN